MSTFEDNQGPKAGRREWIGLAVIALPCLLYSMDLTVLNLAVPHISAALEPSATQLLWIVDIYGFLLAGALITMGTLGDRIGRRKLLMIGAVGFGLASIFAAFSTSAEMLIAARALLGLSAATLAPSTLSLIRNMFLEPKERTFAIGVWIASFSAGGALGPVVGGVLLSYFWWGSVFLIAVPIMLALLIAAPRLLPEFRDPDAGRLDTTSAVLSLLAVLAIIYGIKKVAESGFGGEPALAIAVGLLLGALFVWRQNRLTHPLLDLSLFRSVAFSAALGINILGFFVAFGIFLLTAQYLQLVLGLSPLAAGLWSLPSGVAFILGSQLAPLLVGRMRPAYVIASGFIVTAVGFALLTMASGANALAFIVAGYGVLSLGLAPVFTLATDLIIGSANPQQAGAAAGMAETSSELGGALGIALLGSLVTALYRNAVADGLPEGIPQDTMLAARDTIGAAVAEAARLEGEMGQVLLATARDAYAFSFQAASGVCAVIAVVAALVVIAALRNHRPADGPH
jgi:DHA2 family multidrug resistance protein-like MFS transporter